jgi:hypothetical protein
MKLHFRFLFRPFKCIQKWSPVLGVELKRWLWYLVKHSKLHHCDTFKQWRL